MTDIKKPVKRQNKFYEPYFSYEEIADEIGVTRAAVQQIEQRALLKVGRALRLLGYIKNDFIGKD